MWCHRNVPSLGTVAQNITLIMHMFVLCPVLCWLCYRCWGILTTYLPIFCGVASLPPVYILEDICKPVRWRRHQMETFSALLAICAGNSPVTSEFPAQRPVTSSSHVSFDLCLNKRLSKQWWGWWFEAPSRLLWRHSNGFHSIPRQSQKHNASSWAIL